MITAQTEDFVRRFEEATEQTAALRERIVALTTEMARNHQQITSVTADINENQRALRRLKSATNNGENATEEQRQRMRALAESIEHNTARLGEMRAAESELRSALAATNHQLDAQRSAIMNLPDLPDNQPNNNDNDDQPDDGSEAENISAGLFKKITKAASAIGLGKIISDSIMNGGDLEQNLGGVEVVFDKYADSMRGKAETAFKDMGLSESDYLATANKMGALFKGTGMDAASAAAMSQQAMQRAADVASIMGIDTASAMEAVTGAAKGNFTMMDNLGVAINDTSLQIYAQEKGLGKLETTQQKVNAAMQMFFDKTEYAAGNYARENETFSGSLSTFKAEIDNLSADLGTTLLPTAISVITMARDGLEVISPLVIGLGEGINGVCQYINDLSPSAKTMLGLAVGFAVAIPAVTKAQALYNAANGAWNNLLNILIPKEITRATVLKATVGWLAIIAGMLALVADVGATAREMQNSESESMENTAESTDNASESVDGLADSYAWLGKEGEKAKKSLADIDTLNIFDGGSASTGGVDFEAVTSGAENASDMVAGLTDELGGLTDELDGLNGLSLDGLGDTFSNILGNIWRGLCLVYDAFNFDSDTQYQSLLVLSEKVKGIFGEGWITHWTNVGATINRAFGPNNSEYDREMALTDIQNWLDEVDTTVMEAVDSLMGGVGTAWHDFWFNLGSNFNEANVGREIENSQKFSTLYADINNSLVENLKQGMEAEEALNAAKDKYLGKYRGTEAAYYYDEQGWDERLNFVYAYELQEALKKSGQINPVEEYSYTDYGPPASSMQSYQSSSEIDWSKMGPRLPEEGQERSFNFEIHNYVEMDGNRVGESVTEYQTREAARSNGY